MSVIHSCSTDVVQPSVDQLCMSENWFGAAVLEVCCFPSRAKCSDEESCEEMLSKLKKARTSAKLAYASNGSISSISRDGRSKTYRGVKAIKEHLGWLDLEIYELETKCGSLVTSSCGCCGPCGCTKAFNNPSSIGFTGGRW